MSTLGNRQGALKVDRWATLRRQKFPAREHIINPLLLEGESLMLWAPPGLGKSMLAMTVALAVAGGGTVCGWTFDKPRPVLIVDGEQARQDIQDRLAMLEGTIEGYDPEAGGRNLAVMARTNQLADVEFPDLASDKGKEQVRRRACGMHAALVVIDNFATLADMSDENEASAMQPVLKFLIDMKQTGIATMLVHHSDKGGSNYRGSSKLATTFEVILGLFKIDGRSELDGAGFEMRVGKFRGKRTVATRDAELTLEDTPQGPRWNVKPTTSGERTALLEAVRSCEFASQDALAEKFGWSKAKLSKLKAKAIGLNEITRREWDECMAVARGESAEGDF